MLINSTALDGHFGISSVGQKNGKPNLYYQEVEKQLSKGPKYILPNPARENLLDTVKYRYSIFTYEEMSCSTFWILLTWVST